MHSQTTQVSLSLCLLPSVKPSSVEPQVLSTYTGVGNLAFQKGKGLQLDPTEYIHGEAAVWIGAGLGMMASGAWL